MIETKFMGKSLFIDSLEDLEAKNAVFSVEFDHNYKAILLRTKSDSTLKATLRAFIWASRHNMYGPRIKKCVSSSTSIAVCVEYRCADNNEDNGHRGKRINKALQTALAHKIVELCTYAPYGYNLKVSQNCFYDDDTINRLVKEELHAINDNNALIHKTLNNHKTY